MKKTCNRREVKGDMWKMKHTQSAHNTTLTMTCLLSWSLSDYHPESGSRTSSPCDLAALGSHVHCLLLSSSCKHSSFMCSCVSSCLYHTPCSSSTDLCHTVSTFNYRNYLLSRKMLWTNNATIYLYDISRCVPLRQPDSLLWKGVGRIMFRYKFSKKIFVV
jgi:hypothetical protein